MEIKVQLRIDGHTVKEETLVIEEAKLEPLSEEEVEQTVEIQVRAWADRILSITWEAEREE